MDQKKNLTGISMAEIDLGHHFHWYIWKTLAVSSTELGKPGHRQSWKTPYLTTVPCVNERHQLGCLHTQPRPHQPLAGLDTGSCWERGNRGLREGSLKAATFLFLLQSQPGSCTVPLCGHCARASCRCSLPARGNILFHPSASNRELQWQCFFLALTALTLPEALLRVLSIFFVKYNKNPSH